MIREILNDFSSVCGNSRFIRRVNLFFFHMPFHLLVYFRVAHWMVQSNLEKFVYIVIYSMQKVTSCYIHPKARIGMNCNFPHPLGIVIGEKVKIGNNVTIYQNVTLGVKANRNGEVGYPTIYDNVTIYAGAVLIGPVSIGKGAIIGAGSVVICDVPENTIVAGNPAKIINSVTTN